MASPTSKRTRGPYSKGRKRRAEIVAAAMEVFARSGYQNAAFATVAEQVGLTLPGLLHHFPTKVDLLLAVLEQRDEDTRRLLPDAKGSWQQMVHGLVATARYNETIPEVIRVFALLSVESLTEDHPAANWFGERTKRTRDMVAAAFARGLRDGSLKPGSDPESLASEILAMMDGLQEQWLRAGGGFDMIAIFETYAERLIRDRQADS